MGEIYRVGNVHCLHIIDEFSINRNVTDILVRGRNFTYIEYYIVYFRESREDGNDVLKFRISVWNHLGKMSRVGSRLYFTDHNTGYFNHLYIKSYKKFCLAAFEGSLLCA